MELKPHLPHRHPLRVLIPSLLAAALCGRSYIIQCASHPHASLSSQSDMSFNRGPY